MNSHDHIPLDQANSPRVLLLTHAITSGGAERVMSILANAWIDKGWDVTLATLDDGSIPPFYPLDPRLPHLTIAASRQSVAGKALVAAGSSSGVLGWLMRNKLATLWNVARRALRVRRGLVEQTPEVVISFIDQMNILTLLALAGTGIPVIISERIDPAHHRIGWVWEFLRFLAYPWADRLVVQVDSIQKQFHGRVRRRTRVIPNPVLPPPLLAEPSQDSPEQTLVAVGRLVPQKGFDLLLRVFASLAKRHPDWKLVIWGEGPERQELIKLLEDLDLKDRAFLPGNHPRIYEALAQADIFVLSSRFEGFPNALCEAMAVGLPVVAFDCPSGPSQIVRPGQDGLLVPPEDAIGLEESLEVLMSDPTLRESMGMQARMIVQRFSLPNVLGQWEACIWEVLREHG